MSLDGQFVRQGDIYQEWKKRLEHLPAEGLIAELTLLVRDGRFYHRLVVPEQEPDVAIGRQLARLNRWGIQTFYPFLLNIYRRYDGGELIADQFVAILRLLESFLVRRFFARVPTNQLNRLFIRLAQQLPADLDLVEATRVALSKPGLRWPTDPEFRAAILRLPLYTEGRYDQRRLIIETFEKSYGHKEAVDLAGLTIEHVMPQTLTPEWQASLGDDVAEVHGALLHVLGNLTLTGYNAELSNRPFAEKRAALAQSNIQMNKAIAQETDWTGAEIEARAERLADRALTLWPGPLMIANPVGPVAAGKATTGSPGAPPRWDEAGVFAALENCCSPAGLQAARGLFDYARERGAQFYFNPGPVPAVSALFPIGSRFTSLFGLSEWPSGKGIVTINFEYLLSGGVRIEALARLAQRLREIPGVEERFKDLEAQGFKKRPSLGIDQILAQPEAVQAIRDAFDELLRQGNEYQTETSA